MPHRLAPLLVVLCFAAAPVAAAPIEAYGRLPSLEDAALSPDGSMIAFVNTTADQRLIFIYSLKDDHTVGGVRVGDEKLRAIEWADDEHLLLTLSTTTLPMGLVGPESEWSQMLVFDVRTHKLRPLLNHVTDAQVMNVVTGVPMVRRDGGDTILYLHGYYVSGRTLPALFKVNLRSGVEQLIRQGSASTDEWLVNDGGQVIAEQDYFERDKRWSIRIATNGHLADAVSGVEAIDRPSILGFDPGGEAIVVAVAELDGIAWKRLSLKDGAWVGEFAPGIPASRPLIDPRSQRLIGAAAGVDAQRYVFFDPGLQDRWDWATRTFPGETVEFVSLSGDRSKALVQVSGARSGYAYFVADFAERLTTPVGQVYAGIDAIAEVRRITYAAADGLEIPAYLTLPPGRPPRDLPVVVLPHGGPVARDSSRFDWWSQALAAQGYAVLQPNFRGSNLGRAWVERGFGEWGRKMQSDVSDGLRYLARLGIVDPKRASIVGASYGGYVALAGVALEPGVYRCAVAVAGVSDPRNFLRWVNARTLLGEQSSLRFWDRFLGVSSADDPRLNDISPLRHAAAVSVPVLLIHGRDDTVVPYEQSTDMAKALTRAGRPVEFVALAKEDHWLSRSATRLQMLKASVEFLARCNPAD
jgi:dipeptidyl aminopeptidase/acylaminoacyl peptidase